MDILHDNYGISRDDEELVKTMKQIKEQVIKEEGFPMIEGVPQLLKRLKDGGYCLAIASSSPPFLHPAGGDNPGNRQLF